MIKEFVSDLAAQMGMQLFQVTVDCGSNAFCTDACVLDIESGGRLASVLVYKADLDALSNGFHCEGLEIKIRSALSRLQMMLEP